MKTYRSALAAAALVAPMFAMTAFATPETPRPTQAGQEKTDPSVIIFDQRSGGTEVNFTYAYLPSDGYVAVYGADDDGNVTGDVLGYVPLAAGDHRNISVDIGKELESGMTLWASLYRDVDGDKKLNKDQDTAFWPDGKPLENSFNVL